MQKQFSEDNSSKNDFLEKSFYKYIIRIKFSTKKVLPIFFHTAQKTLVPALTALYLSRRILFEQYRILGGSTIGGSVHKMEHH